MEEPIEVLDAKITIRSELSFLTDVKKKLDQPGNEKRKTLFLETKFGIWLNLSRFANDNHLLNYIFHHRVYAEPSVECPPISYRICGNAFEFGRQEFCLITGFLFGKLPKEESYKGIPNSNFLDRIFPDRSSKRVKKVKGDDLMELFTNDELWFGISDHDAVRVCLLLVATIVFMGRETRYNIPDNVLELVDDLPVWNSYPWGEYFWRIFYRRTFNVLQRKNEKDFKKDKDKSVEPPKKKIKVGKFSKKKNKFVEASSEKMTRYNLYGFVWAVKFEFFNQRWQLCYDKTGRFNFGFGDNDLNIQPVDYDEPQNTNNAAKENALCEFDAIRPDDYDEADNSYIMDKEDVLGEFYAIKATIGIIDKRKGEVSTDCLEKQLDLVKHMISVLEQALKQRYHNTSEDSVKQACNKSDSGVSDVFHQELASKKHQFTDEETKLNETVVDCATVQATLPPNAIEEHEYHPTDKVEVQELHPPPKTASLINNFEEYVGSDDMLGPVGEDQINFDTRNEVFQDRVVMMAIEENIADYFFQRRNRGGYLTRQPGANWAIAGPLFYAFMMRADVPFWPANGIKYHVP
nr:hypothetical protein [Tanacetum cinerariifolium]